MQIDLQLQKNLENGVHLLAFCTVSERNCSLNANRAEEEKDILLDLGIITLRQLVHD